MMQIWPDGLGDNEHDEQLLALQACRSIVTMGLLDYNSRTLIGANVRYTSLDPEYLAKLDDVVLIHTATQYHSALSQMSEVSPPDGAEIGHIRVLYTAVRLELERRGLEPDGWLKLGDDVSDS